jgi:hypothetical protein
MWLARVIRFKQMARIIQILIQILVIGREMYLGQKPQPLALLVSIQLHLKKYVMAQVFKGRSALANAYLGPTISPDS